MDPSLEITAMPAPQWLFGYEISEEQRLLFARLYLEYARSIAEGPLYEQPSSSLASFLDQCTARGLRLAVPRELAIDILRRPDVFGWAHPFAQRARSEPRCTRSVIERGRAFFTARGRGLAKRG
jgi:hypothetical protein